MATKEQIEKWADEAEVGYDVEELKRRGRGRPGRGAEPMQVVAVRLTAEEIASLDAIADREHLTRSEAIRRALADFAAGRSTRVRSSMGYRPRTLSKPLAGRTGLSLCRTTSGRIVSCGWASTHRRVCWKLSC